MKPLLIISYSLYLTSFEYSNRIFKFQTFSQIIDDGRTLNPAEPLNPLSELLFEQQNQNLQNEENQLNSLNSLIKKPNKKEKFPLYCTSSAESIYIRVNDSKNYVYKEDYPFENTVLLHGNSSYRFLYWVGFFVG